MRIAPALVIAVASAAAFPAFAQVTGPPARPEQPAQPEKTQPQKLTVPRAGFLFLNQERILTGSRAGQALLAEEEAARDQLRAEARTIDGNFEAEERSLTERRPTLAPEEFRKLADAFDARVVEARREQDERSTSLAQEFDQRRRAFYAQVAPILVMLMDRFGALAILDESSVLLADQSINITEEVIAEIDARAEAAPDAGAGDEGN
jgi:Skp family chaperone for outer membrane proteins